METKNLEQLLNRALVEYIELEERVEKLKDYIRENYPTDEVEKIINILEGDE